jgi:PAS domain S-box-containing protein
MSDVAVVKQHNVALRETVHPPDPQSMFSTAELSRRPSRPPDYAAESRAFIDLAREMVISPESILQKLAETALTLCRAHSAGLSILEAGDHKRYFHWRAIAGRWAPHVNGETPRDFGPCGTVLNRNMALMCSHPERDFPYFGEVEPLLEEALLIPFYVEGEAVGTIWVVSHDWHRFEAEDLRLMADLGAFTAAAYQTWLSVNAIQRVAAIVDSSDDAIISKDLNGVITTWNKGAERTFGYGAEEVIGKPITILIPPAHQNEEHEILERIRSGQRIEHYETVRRRKNGSLIDVSLTVSPVKNAKGKIIGASKIARDITERKLSLAMLRALPEAVYTTDAAGRLTFYNDAAAEFWGYRPKLNDARWCGSWRLLRTDGSLLPHDECPMAVAIKENRPVRGVEAIAERPNGMRVPFLPYPTPLHDPSGKVIGAVNMLVDISERKRSEEQIATLAREAEHRAKNVLATVQAAVHLTQSDTTDGLKHAIEGRIRALANVHALFVQSRWTGAELRNLLAQELSPYCQDGETRARTEGPSLLLEPNTAQAIAVTLHELATNAAKYGAWSVPQGLVRVEWSRESDGRLLLRWSETGGPTVKAPTHKGFGTRVMESMIRGQLKGEVNVDWRSEGLVCEIVVPA